LILISEYLKAVVASKRAGAPAAALNIAECMLQLAVCPAIQPAG
jgi:replication-associated recombination protein RarA